MKKFEIKKYITFISIFLAMFVGFGLQLKFNKAANFVGYAERANDMIYLIFIISINLLIYYNMKNKNKRLWITSIIVGIIFSICYYLGDIQNDYISTSVPVSKKFALYSFIKLITYFIIFTNCVNFLFYKMEELIKKFDINKKCKFFDANKKSLILVALIFFLTYIPFFLNYYPGNIVTDSIGSILQITGRANYTNFQPLLYTFILGGIWNLGKAIFGSSVAGIALYSIFQMICTSITFSFVLYYMAKKNISLKWRIITFLFLILNPLNGWFVVRCEKGMLFHLSLIWVILGIIDIIDQKEEFFNKKWKPILFAFITLIMLFIRNNGIYGLLLTIPFLLIACKKYLKQNIILFGTILAITFIIQGPIFKIFHIEYSRPGEALTVPMQQYARIAKYGEDRLTDEEKEVIHKYFPVSIEKLSNDYMPWKADFTKANFSADEFVKDKGTFFKQYFKFAIKYPVQTASSFILNTGENYSPNFNVWGLLRNFETETDDGYGTCGKGESKDFDEFIEQYPLKAEKLVNIEFLDKINEELVKGTIPILTIVIENIGFYFWLLVLCFAYCVYKKQYKDIVMLLPILGLWVTTIAAPMVDLRFIYSMFLIMPVYIGIIAKNSRTKYEKR